MSPLLAEPQLLRFSYGDALLELLGGLFELLAGQVVELFLGLSRIWEQAVDLTGRIARQRPRNGGDRWTGPTDRPIPQLLIERDDLVIRQSTDIDRVTIFV